jgi:RNA polymerase sigma-70 factor (ECF subfamily)
VQELPEAYRASIMLFYFEERSVAETASMLGLGEATLKTRLHRGRAMLLRRITQAGLGDPGMWLSQEDGK